MREKFALLIAERTWAMSYCSVPLEVEMALRNFKLFLCLLFLSDSTVAQAKCLRTSVSSKHIM
jgi:hypothetical protein